MKHPDCVVPVGVAFGDLAMDQCFAAPTQLYLFILAQSNAVSIRGAATIEPAGMPLRSLVFWLLLNGDGPCSGPPLERP